MLSMQIVTYTKCYLCKMVLRRNVTYTKCTVRNVTFTKCTVRNVTDPYFSRTLPLSFAVHFFALLCVRNSNCVEGNQ